MSRKYTRKTAEERRQEVDQLSQSLVDHISAEAASGKIQEILDNLSKVSYDYSLNNVLLIGMQRPDATAVASYGKWQSVNRQVSAGEKGIAIICPVPYKYKTEVPKEDPLTHAHIRDVDGNILTEEKIVDGMSFRIGYVFDISQTEQIEGKEIIPLEIVKNLSGDVGDQYNDLLYAVRESAPVQTEIGQINSAANGYFSHTDQKIVVKDGMSEKQTLKTMIHEVAHSVLHNKEVQPDSSLTYYVSDNPEFPTIGKHLENMSLAEAVKAYKEESSPSKVIGIELETNYGHSTTNIVHNNQIQMSYINDIPHLKENLEVQKALNGLREYFPSDDFSLPTMREVQAESTAYLVAAHYGIDTSDYSIKYITAWADMEPMTVLENLDAVRACAHEIIDRMDTVLETLNEERFGHDPLNAMELAEKLDNYVQTYGDWYDYKDSERYPGSNLDDTLSDLRHGRTDGVNSYLHEMVNEYPGTIQSVKAETLLNDIEMYESTHMSASDDLQMPGMRM